jgi:outer membrane protein assembly factor BamD
VKKKISLFIMVLSMLLAGCAHKEENPWKAYEGKTSGEIFYEGEQHLAKKKYTKAVEDFAALDALYPFGPYTQQGEMNIIYALYMKDDNTSGLAAADRYIRLYPQDSHIDYVYYMKGLMSFEQDFNWYQSLFSMDPAPHDLTGKRESFVAFNQVVRIYPHSIYAQDSALHMAFIRNMMARKEMNIADFYMERRAYVAAANRAAGVVQHYSGSPAVPHALEVMALAYQGAGLPDFADKSYRILAASYPDSPEFKRLQKTYKPPVAG